MLIAAVALQQVENADARKADSLLHIAVGLPDDTTKALLLNYTASLYQTGNPDSMLLLAGIALKLSEKIHFQRGCAQAITQTGTYYLDKSDYDLAVKYYDSALHIYENTHDIGGIAASQYNLGNSHYTKTEFGEALDDYRESISLSRQAGDLKTAGQAYNGIGNIYRDLGNYPQAIQNFLDGLKLFEQVNDNREIPVCYTNIATVYSMMGDYPNATIYINKSLAIANATGDAGNRLYNIVNFGVLQGEQGHYEEALKWLQDGLRLSDSIGDEYWTATCEANIADAYFYLRDYDKAAGLYSKTIAEARAIKELGIVASAENGLGNVLIQKGHVAEGIEHMKIALELSRSRGEKTPMSEIIRDLSAAYEKLGDYKNALIYHKTYFDLRDSVFNDKNKKRIQQLEFDYELGKKENTIKLLEKDKAIERSNSANQRILLWALVSGFSLLAVIVVLLYRNRVREKSALGNILKQKEEIQQQAVRLEELNRFKDKTFSVLSHDLRGPLQALLATMSMMDEHLISEAEFASLRPEVNRQLSSLNILLENLLNWARGYIQGQAQANTTPTELAPLMSQTTSLIQDIAGHKGISMVSDVPAGLYAQCDPGQVDIVIRNLVMNALKFTRAGGAVTISAGREADKIILTIADTGVGMTAEQVSKLFTPVAGNSTYGTEGETGTGLGLLLCYEFIKANNGTISVASEVGKGSKFTVSLPAAVNL